MPMGAKSHRQCLIRVLLLFKYHVATVNGECEAEVVRIYGKMKRRVVPIIEFEDEDEEDIEF